MPLEYCLNQNYPNPFNPTTVISYQLSTVSFVTLEVFDVLGRGITTLVGGIRSGGRHMVTWDGAGLPSGIYFYRLQARQIVGGQSGVYTETRKMILLSAEVNTTREVDSPAASRIQTIS